MLVDCPDCARSYHLGADEIGDRGRLLICPRCDARWFQRSDRLPDDIVSHQRSWHVGSRDAPEPIIKPFGTKPARNSPFRHLPHPQALVAAGLLAAVAGGLVGERELVVRTVPRTAALYRSVGLPVNVRGLDFAQVAAKDAPSGDVTISGEIRNIARRRVGMPRLTFEIRDPDGAPLLSWSENAPARTLGSGKAIAFASAPHRLPPTSSTVLVRFERGDATSTVVAGRSR